MVARILFAVVMALVPLIGTSARADQTPWTSDGVQLRCDAAKGTFEIVAYVRPRDGDAALQKGFKGVREGTSLRGCKLGKRSVLAQIKVEAPHKAGTCERGGRIEIPSLSVNGVELEDKIGALNWWCASDAPAIVRITVKSDPAGVTYALCTIGYASDGTPEDQGCTTRSVAVDKQAAAFAKIDHDLADPATQSAQSATRIPASLDMARVFATPKDRVPLCAHWLAFAWSDQDQDPPWARIGGKPGERTPIHAVYPRLCTRKSDRACDSSAYVIAGDRVDFGAVCGAWTAIRYHPRVRAFPVTIGWVKTARLYGVQLLHEPPRQAAHVRSGEEDPLDKAVDSGDAQTIADLIRDGADPNGLDKSGEPLLYALMNDNLPAVEAMLAAGATPDPGIVGWNRVGMGGLELVAKVERLMSYETNSQKIDPIPLLRILLQHGAKVDAADARGLTPLMRAIDANNVDIAEFLIDAGADPNQARSGDESHDAGYTPLMLALSDYGWHRDPSAIRLLLERGANPDFMTDAGFFDLDRMGYSGETVLTVAAREGYMTIVRDLLDHGADPALPRADGASPADIARHAGFPRIAQLLVQAAKKKADPAGVR